MTPDIHTVESSTIETQFLDLAQQWKAAVALLSSTSAMIAHPAYRAIINLGPPVVPLLLRELEQGPVHWFEALHAITGEDPVPPEDWGKVQAMADAWVRWGRTRRLTRSPC